MANSPAPHTHRIRPRAGNAKWEHVTEQGLATIKAQVGPHSFRSGYEVEPLAEKAEKLATVKPGQPDYLGDKPDTAK